MNLTAICLIALGLHVSANTLSQTVTYSGKNASLEKVFTVVEKQTGYVFFYKPTILKRSRPVTVSATNLSLDAFLQEILKGQQLDYLIENQTIVIRSKKATLKDFGILEPFTGDFIPPPPIIVNGRVTNDKSESLAGVTVNLKGTSTSVATNDRGEFTISVPDNKAVLVISYVGFQTQEVAINSNNAFLSIQLLPGNARMNEVVVVAYGTQKRSSVTSAVATIAGDDIATQPVANVSNAVVGRVPGVIFVQGSGEPGSDAANLLIRGVSTLGNTQPLVVVDGVPRNFNQLDPNSIASISILKDAAAVAPYGMAGANGVLLITTKRGLTGRPSLTYNGYAGWQNPTVVPEFVNSYEYATLFNLATDNQGLPHAFSDEDLAHYKNGTGDPDIYHNSDILGFLINRNQIMTNHNLELSGGGDRVRFYIGLGFLDQKGMWGPNAYKRYNVTANIESDATKTTKVGFSINGRVEDRKSPGIATTSNIFAQAFYQPPIYPILFSNGLPGNFVGQSVYSGLYNSGYRNSVGYSLLNQFFIEQQLPFIKGLSVKGVVSYDFNPFNPINPDPAAPITSIQKNWLTPFPYYTYDPATHTYPLGGMLGPAKPQYTQIHHMTQAFTYQGYLNYNRTFGDHAVSGLVVLEARNTKANISSAARVNYNVNVPELDNGSSSATDIFNSGYSTEAKQRSALFRATYAFANKYLLEIVGRYDGHFAFAPDHRFGFFPAISAGWRVSEENFFRNAIPWITELKIRGSFGESGGLPYINGQLATFQYLSSYSLYGNSSIIGGNAMQGARENAEPNPGITWERAKKTNIGFDANLWHGLLTIEADYFHEKRTGMLLAPNVSVPMEYGVNLSQENAGEMMNRGFELQVGTFHRFSKDLSVGLSTNFTFAKNKLLQFFETPITFANPNRRRTGRPKDTQFGYQALGYFRQEDFNPDGTLKDGIPTQPWGDVHPGDLRYADLGGGVDGKPDGQINDDDLTVIGRPPIPQIVYGFSPSVRYKNFDFSVLFQGAGSKDLYISVYPFDNASSAIKDALDTWTPENQDAAYPRVTTQPTQNNTQRSSHWIKNGAYLRLKTGELGYTIPSRIMDRLKLQRARFYLAAQNLITFTGINNFDPEVTASGYSTSTYNIRYDISYPQQKVVSVGLNLTF